MNFLKNLAQLTSRLDFIRSVTPLVGKLDCVGKFTHTNLDPQDGYYAGGDYFGFNRYHAAAAFYV
jgi:hypothetical protein